MAKDSRARQWGASAKNTLGNPLRMWARSYRGVRELPATAAVQPTITIGANNAPSTIYGSNTVTILPSSTKLTVAGGTLSESSGYWSAASDLRARLRFVHVGRRFEVKLQSTSGRGIAVYVDGELVTPADFPAGLNVTQNQFVLFDYGSNTVTHSVVSGTVAAGGSGYAVGDEITVAGGTSTTPAVLRVVSVSSGAVTGVYQKTPGSYSVKPTNAVAQASTTGSGTGATFNLTWGQAHSTIKPRRVEIVLDNGVKVAGFNVDTSDMMTPWPVPSTAMRFYVATDSFGDFAFSLNPARNWMRQLAHLIDAHDDSWLHGTSGRGYLVGSTFAAAIPGIIGRAPDVIVVALGLNDSFTKSAAEIEAAVTSQYNTLFASLPDLRIVCVTGWQVSQAIADATAAGALASSKPNQVRTINLTTLGIYTGSTDDNLVSSDASHPSQVGHDALAATIAPLVANAICEMA